MLNIKTLTDTLSDMDLQELHDYARVNKNDPYIVSMALSMANTKKKIDIAQKGRAGMQPQPKVVDQQLAQMVAPPPQQMLPEDQGIGQLPAPNMQGLAGGGIVAFDEGGEVPGYAGPSGSFVSGNNNKVIPALPDNLRNYIIAQAKLNKIDPNVALAIADAERGPDVNTQNTRSTAKGIFQITEKPYLGAGGDPAKRNDPYENIRIGTKLLGQNAQILRNQNKREPTAGELYTTHFLGSPTGTKLLTADPNMPIKDFLRSTNTKKMTEKILASNPEVMGGKKTVGDIRNWADKTVNKRLNKIVSTESSLGEKETLVQPTQTTDPSIPINYKQEQAAQQAVYDAEVKSLKNQGFLDKTKRVGRGLLGLGEAGTNFLGQLTTYPTAAIASVIDDPSAAGAAIQNKPEGAAFYKAMTDRQNEATYDPRTPEGQYYNEIKNKFLSGLSPYLGHLAGGKPQPKQVKPGLPALMESPVVKAVEPAPPVVSPAVKAAQAKQAAARAAVQQQVGQPKPTFQTAVETAQAKQAAARAALSKDGPEIGNRFFEPEAPAFPIAPEYLAVKEAAAAKLKAAQPKPAPVEGQTFPITPENSGVALVQRNKLALENQAEVARRNAVAAEEVVKPKEVVKPEEAAKPKELVKPEEVVKEPAMSVAEQLDRARAYELQKQKESVIRNRQTAVQTTLPGAAQALPAEPVEENVPGLAPNENIDESVFDPTYGGKLPLPEKIIVDKLEDKTGKSSEELKKQADDMGMDWNSFLIRFGLGLMAGESQYASVNVGKAGLGALDAQLAEQKSRQAQAASVSESELKKMQAKYYGSFADAIERGAKEKDSLLEAEKLVQQRMEKWSTGPGKLAEAFTPGATAREEDRVRKAIYQQLGIQPTIAAGAPALAGGFSVVGSRPS